MDDYKDSVMIALLPIQTEWSKQSLPHLTVVYAGRTFDLTATEHNEMLKTVASIAFETSQVRLRVMGVEVFGGWDSGNEPVDVLTLQSTPELLRMRRRVERWNASQFPFNPHVTIGPKGSFDGLLPLSIAFDRILVAWGDQQTIFWLKP